MTAPGSFNTLHLNLTRPPLTICASARRSAMPSTRTDRGRLRRWRSADGRGHRAAIRGLGEEGRAAAGASLRPRSKKAKALLAEAGFPNGLTIPCYTSQREDYASIMLIIQEQLRAAGINID